MVEKLEQQKEAIDEAAQIVESQAMYRLVRAVGVTCSVFYKTLIDQGVPPEAAAVITANYASNTPKTG